MFPGTKLLLRDKKVADAPDDYAWRTDPELARFDATTPLRSSYNEFLEAYLEELTSPKQRQRRYAIESLDGKHIGNCMYYNIDLQRRQVELGILVGDRDYWNRGYGTDAVLTLLDYIFGNISVERVYLHTLEWNRRAQVSFAKCGFMPYQRVWRDGQEFIAMELWRRDWEAAQNPPEA